jgi:alkylation response protein AidB-like acyl-CoA dehydrogenase
MNFDFSDEQKSLRDHVRRFLSEKCPTTLVRQGFAASPCFDAGLYKSLGELGVLAAAIPRAYGGLSLGYLELCVLAEELGRSLAPFPVSSSLYLAAEFLLAAGTEAQKRRLLPGLGNADIVGTFAFAEGPGRISQEAIHAMTSDGRLHGVKMPVPDGDTADFAVVAAQDGAGAGLSLYLVDLESEGVTRSAVDTIDPSRSQARLVFEHAHAEPLGAPGQAWPLIERVLDRAAVLLAFEQIGGADRALEMARDYALDRMAFGRQIGSFQALKHMMADMYVSTTLARSNAYYGAWALSTDAAELPVAAATARISATEAFRHCAKNNIQVHGGMGFTWEADCHLYYRRASGLSAALGSPSVWEERLIERLVLEQTKVADRGDHP